MLNKKRILVTGATGFVGNYVINELLKNNQYEIIATSRDSIKASQQKWFGKVQYLSYDINENRSDIFNYFQKPDILVHLAWEGLFNYNDVIHIEHNLMNHYFFLKNLITCGLNDINCVGTCFEYGIINGCLSEEMKTNPSNSYAIAKDCLRKFLEDLYKKLDFKYKWIRLFYMYGEGQSRKSLLSQVDKAISNGDKIFNMSKGEQLRDYLEIKTVAEYIVKISLQENVKGIINCASGIPISIRALVENYLKNKNCIIELNLGYYDYPDYEPMAFWADTSKLNKILKDSSD